MAMDVGRGSFAVANVIVYQPVNPTEAQQDHHCLSGLPLHAETPRRQGSTTNMVLDSNSHECFPGTCYLTIIAVTSLIRWCSLLRLAELPGFSGVYDYNGLMTTLPRQDDVIAWCFSPRRFTTIMIG